MSYLSEDELMSIKDTVSIYSISDEETGDVSQYPFFCGIATEYADFLYKEAKILDELYVSKTFVVIHNATRELIGYFSLAADVVRLTDEEKRRYDLTKVSFNSLPALKVGKLAVNKTLSAAARRKGYGSFILSFVNSFAYAMNKNGIACRFLTVDADIEYSRDTPQFYAKNGFIPNQSRKPRATDRTVSMHRDIMKI